MRFWNDDVRRNLDGVIETIKQGMRARLTPLPDPLPQGERGKD